MLPYEAGWATLLRRPLAPDEETLALKLLDRAGVLARLGCLRSLLGQRLAASSACCHAPEEFRWPDALHEWLPRLNFS